MRVARNGKFITFEDQAVNMSEDQKEAPRIDESEREEEKAEMSVAARRALLEIYNRYQNKISTSDSLSKWSREVIAATKDYPELAPMPIVDVIEFLKDIAKGRRKFKKPRKGKPSYSPSTRIV